VPVRSFFCSHLCSLYNIMTCAILFSMVLYYLRLYNVYIICACYFHVLCNNQLTVVMFFVQPVTIQSIYVRYMYLWQGSTCFELH